MLWENNNPKNNFSATTLNINWSQYKRIGIHAYYTTTNDVANEFVFNTSLGSTKILMTFTSMYASVKGREIEFGNGTIKITDGKTGTTNSDNAVAIPFKIVGYNY